MKKIRIPNQTLPRSPLSGTAVGQATFSISLRAVGVIAHTAVVGNDLYYPPFYILGELIINWTGPPTYTLQMLCMHFPFRNHCQYCFVQPVSITLSILFRSWRMIDLIDLCQRSDMATSTGGNFVGGARRGTGDSIFYNTTSCSKRKCHQRCLYCHRRDRTGAQTDTSEQRDISHDRVYSKSTAKHSTV